MKTIKRVKKTQDIKLPSPKAEKTKIVLMGIHGRKKKRNLLSNKAGGYSQTKKPILK